jgi:hypothetical protein
MKSMSERMAELPEPKDGPWPDWDHWRLDVWKHGIEDDPESFPTWACVRHTMLVEWRDMKQRYTALPKRYKDVCDSLASPLRESAIEQASHLWQWQMWTLNRIAEMGSIYEFGAGYGQMAWICRKVGFQGDYYICELPEFRVLQEWWLDKEAIEAKWTDKPIPCDLLIAIYSISELPAEDRMAAIPPTAHHVYAYTETRTSWDQLTWFKKNIPGTHIQMSDRKDWYCFL